jgi:hypothetical protein
VDVSGVSLLGGTDVENAPDPGPGAPTIHIRAFSVIGGIRVRRSGRRPRGGQSGSQVRKDEKRAWKDQRHEERHARHDERRRERRGY